MDSAERKEMEEWKREKKERGNANSSRDLPSWCPLQALEEHGQLHLPRAHCSPLGLWIRSWCTAIRTWSFISFLYGPMSVGDLLDFPELPSACPLPSLVLRPPFSTASPISHPHNASWACVFSLFYLGLFSGPNTRLPWLCTVPWETHLSFQGLSVLTPSPF